MSELDEILTYARTHEEDSEWVAKAEAELARLREAEELVAWIKAGSAELDARISATRGWATMYCENGNWVVVALDRDTYRGPSLSAALAALKGDNDGER